MAAKPKDPVLEGLPPVETYLAQLDLERVAEAIQSGSRMTESDFSDAKRMVWEAAERWLLRDLVDLHVTGIELAYEKEINLPVVGRRQIKGILDILGSVRGRLNDTLKTPGARVAIDWKTTSNVSLDSKWKDKYLDSWQWKLYGTLIEPVDLFIYRGITRPVQEDPDKPPKCKFAEIVIPVPADLGGEVENHIAGLFAARQSLIDGRFAIWPQERPRACGAFGRDCPYLHDCPGGPSTDFPAEKSFSYSSMGLFQMCAERYRRHVMDGLVVGAIDLEESDATILGNSVHRGLAELYQQAIQKFTL